MYRFGTAVLNCRRLLKDRGYSVPDDTTDAFKTAGAIYVKARSNKLSLGEAVRTTYKHPDGRLVSVWCLDRNYDVSKNKERMISTDQIKALGELINGPVGPGGPGHIVLSPNKLSPQAKREYLCAELFLFDELMIDLPRHELVVRHKPITQEEAKSILGPSLLVSDLPRLPMTDPMARWHGFQAGQVVFIDNPSLPSFRVVVKA